MLIANADLKGLILGCDKVGIAVERDNRVAAVGNGGGSHITVYRKEVHMSRRPAFVITRRVEFPLCGFALGDHIEVFFLVGFDNGFLVFVYRCLVADVFAELNNRNHRQTVLEVHLVAEILGLAVNGVLIRAGGVNDGMLIGFNGENTGISVPGIERIE